MLFYLILNHLIKIYYSLYKIKVFTLSIELIFICQYKYHASGMVCIDLDVHVFGKMYKLFNSVQWSSASMYNHCECHTKFFVWF